MTDSRSVTAASLAARAAGDGEFRLAARYWDGSLEVDLGNNVLRFAVNDGKLTPAAGEAGGRAIRLAAPLETWAKVLAPIPPPFFNDILPAAVGGMVIDAEAETLWQYYPAVRRFVDLLREEVN